MGGLIELEEQEIHDLYRLLKREEEWNDVVLSRLLRRIEEHLFQNLTIEEIEGLQDRRR